MSQYIRDLDAQNFLAIFGPLWAKSQFSGKTPKIRALDSHSNLVLGKAKIKQNIGISHIKLRQLPSSSSKIELHHTDTPRKHRTFATHAPHKQELRHTDTPHKHRTSPHRHAAQTPRLSAPLRASLHPYAPLCITYPTKKDLHEGYSCKSCIVGLTR